MHFVDKLQILNMIPQQGGLLLVSEKDSPNITETERRILNIAERDYKANAVYFRKFDSNRASIPQIFIYENSDSRLSDNEKIEIHKRIWTSEIVPLYYIFENTQLSIINGKRKIAFKKGQESFQDTITNQIDLIQDIENQYDALKYPYKSYFFDNDSFWDTEVYKQQFITNESPFKLLISYLKDLKKEISSKVSEQVLNRLIVQCILIKYLEEKRDDNGNNIFTVKSNLFKEKWQSDTFVDVIRSGNLLNLFDYLSGHYNGKVFEWDKNNEKEERQEVLTLSQDTRNYLAAYFDGNLNFKTKELALWRYYSFQYLPVELISRIYEEFLPSMPGVVYTPPFLVDFLIDECMPINDYQKFYDNNFRILDPSLGSGIFCVSAYKRLIDWYRINRYYQEKKAWYEPISSSVLKSILKNNIFGTDVEKEAVRIAIFSLTIALLESLTPIQIFEDLEFEDLGKENILNENFFNFFNKNLNAFSENENFKFDLIIGNPPFNPPLNIKNAAYLKQMEKDYNISFSHKIPDDNLALAFLDRVIVLCKKSKGLTCLVLPSGPLLYGSWTMEYRNSFLKEYSVPQIIDFTHLRESLFVSKDEETNRKKNRIATVAIFAKNEKPQLETDKIWHIIANRTKKEQNRLFFFFDHYDFHIIPYEKALTERYIWKANLLGGSRLCSIAKRLSDINRTIRNFIVDENKWKYTGGYKIGNRKNNFEIEGKYFISGGAINDDGINYASVKKETEIKCETFPKENIFDRNQLVIRRNITTSGRLIIGKIDYEAIEQKVDSNIWKQQKGIYFKNDVIGICYPPSEEKKATEFVYDFNVRYNKIYPFFALLISGASLIRKESEILKTDIDNLPYPLNRDELKLSEIEALWCSDVLEYYIHQGKSPDNNPLNNFLEDGEKQVKEFGDIFCKIMEANYKLDDNSKFQQGETFETPSYIATSFHYTDENILFSFKKSDEREFIDYFTKQTGRNQKITRILRYRQDNTIWLIKPRLLRYWIKSIADRDAIDCINDILMNND